MRTLTETKSELKNLLPEGIDVLISGIKTAIQEGSDKFNDLLLLEGRYKDANRQLLQGTMGDEAAQIQFNKIRKDLLEFIETLEDNHLASSDGKGVDGKPDIHNGEILYRIPKQMKKEEEVKCLVRLAFDRSVITQDLEKQEGDVMKDIRIAEVMGVELIDMSGNAFQIRTLHDVVQFVEKDLFTEWVFYVKPLLEGVQNLVLKISIIEIKNGVERKRNVVLEEKVEIVATTPKESGVKEEFQKAGLALAVTLKPKGGSDGAPPPSPSPLPASPAKGMGGKKLLSVMSAMLALVVASFAIYNYMETGGNTDNPGGAVTVNDPEKTDWDDLRNNPTNESVRDFIRKHPNGDFENKAHLMLDSLENMAYESALAANDPDKLREYMDDYPNGKFSDEVAGVIALIESGGGSAPVAIEGQAPAPAAPEIEVIEEPGRINEPEVNQEKDNAGNTPPNSPPITKVDPNEPVPMASAARLPIYRSCKNKDKDKEEACTDRRIGQYIKGRLKYPEEAQQKRIEGVVNVGFVVEKDGSITDVHFNDDIGGGCGAEAIRLVRGMSKFTPGLNSAGEPIRVSYNLPVRFKLE